MIGRCGDNTIKEPIRRHIRKLNSLRVAIEIREHSNDAEYSNRQTSWISESELSLERAVIS